MKRYMQLLRRCLTGGRPRTLVVRATILGLLIAAVPGIAQAGTGSLTITADSPGAGPAPASGEVTSSADCLSGNWAVGGGVTIATSADGTMAGAAQRLEGTEPSGNGVDSSANGTTDPRFWLGVDGAGPVNDTNGNDVAYAVCDTANWSGGVTIETTSMSGPTTSLTAKAVTLGCSSGTLIGGGAYANPPNQAMSIVASYPSNSSGQPVADSTEFVNGKDGGNPMYWTAVAYWGGTPSGTPFTQVWAICATTAVTFEVAQASTSGPTGTFTTARATTPGCSGELTSSNIVGGGFSVDSHLGNYNGSTNYAATNQNGVHGIGDYPSNSSGGAFTGTGGQNWTGDGHSGGQSVSGVDTHAWAICGV